MSILLMKKNKIKKSYASSVSYSVATDRCFLGCIPDEVVGLHFRAVVDENVYIFKHFGVTVRIHVHTARGMWEPRPAEGIAFTALTPV